MARLEKEKGGVRRRGARLQGKRKRRKKCSPFKKNKPIRLEEESRKGTKSATEGREMPKPTAYEKSRAKKATSPRVIFRCGARRKKKEKPGQKTDKKEGKTSNRSHRGPQRKRGCGRRGLLLGEEGADIPKFEEELSHPTRKGKRDSIPQTGGGKKDIKRSKEKASSGLQKKKNLCAP